MPSSLQPAPSSTGMVAKATFPPASFCSCCRKSITSQPEEITIERCTACSNRLSVDGTGQRPARDDPVGQRGHHRLLAHHPVQVAARQLVALADEAERLRTVELLPAGRKVGTRKGFEHRLFEADVDAAERVGDQREAEQPDLGVVVDGDAGQVGDRLDQRLATGLGAATPRLRRPTIRLAPGWPASASLVWP